MDWANRWVANDGLQSNTFQKTHKKKKKKGEANETDGGRRNRQPSVLNRQADGIRIGTTRNSVAESTFDIATELDGG
jgi:hypothetical protein